MSNKKRRYFTATQKISILREHLLEKKSISDICETYDLKPGVFYDWQRKFFENGALALASKGDPAQRRLKKKVQALEAELAKKDHIIAVVTEEFVKAKKISGES